jgi:hypothetical protein
MKKALTGDNRMCSRWQLGLESRAWNLHLPAEAEM